MFDRDERVLLGETMLLDRAGDGQREIGYWLGYRHAGKGYATEGAAAMTRVAFELDRVRRVEIQCAPENTRSVAVAVRLGFEHEATLAARVVDTEGTTRDLMIWTMTSERYPASLSARLQLAAYDGLGKPLPLAR
jgi:RimJ/RimL family protein N-acetyltransferase